MSVLTSAVAVNVVSINVFRGGLWAKFKDGKQIRFESMEAGLSSMFDAKGKRLNDQKQAISKPVSPSTSVSPIIKETTPVVPSFDLEGYISGVIDTLIGGNLMQAMELASKQHKDTGHDAFGDFRDKVNKEYPVIGQPVLEKVLVSRGIVVDISTNTGILTHSFRGTIKKLKQIAAYDAITTATLGRKPLITPTITPTVEGNSPAYKAFELHKQYLFLCNEAELANSRLNSALDVLQDDEMEAYDTLVRA